LEFLIQYGMFLAKAVTIVLAILIILSAIASASSKQKKGERKGSIKVSLLNEHFDEMRDEVRHAVLEKDELKAVHKLEKKQAKVERKEKKKHKAESDQASVERKKRVYVLNFKGDISANAVISLREEITATLSMAEEQDEVLLRLESPGGMVHAYGLASSQLLRIKNDKIPLTICVDKVAASGGYMMACLADRLVAAPFAMIGSIGVLVQVPNFYRVLKKHDVDYEMISAGEYKRTLTTFGEITKKGKEKVQEDVQVIHDIFKQWVKDHRPSVDIEKISTGEVWVGMQAKEKYMVDEIKTSDECIVSACDEADVYEVEFIIRKSIHARLGSVFEHTAEKLFSNWFEKSNQNNFY